MTFFKSKTWKWIRNGVIIFSTLIALIVGGASSIIYFYEDEITKYALEQLTKELNTDLQIESVDLTLVKTFPEASLVFNNVKAKDATVNYKKNNLFKASEIYLSFNFWDIFSRKYNIRKIKINNGNINIKIYPDGSNNYQILKPTSDTGSSKFAFQLKKVILNNVYINYYDAPTNLNISTLAHFLTFKGKFTEKQYSMNVDANLDFDRIEISKTNYFNRKGVELELLLNVFENKKFDFDKSEILFADQSFSILGSIENQEKGILSDLKIKGRDLNINNLISQLPKGVLEEAKTLNGEGEMYFDATLKGYLNNSPKIAASFGIKNGSLENKSNNMKLENINLNGLFSNGEKRSNESTTLELKQFQASINNGKITGNLYIQNFIHPSIKLSGEAELDFSDIQNLLQIDTIESITGKTRISVNYNGTLASMNSFSKDDFNNSICDGKIIIENTSIKLKKNALPFNSINGTFNFNNSDLAIDELQLKVGSSDFNLIGNIKNFIPYILIPNQPLQVNADIKCNKINLDELLANQSSTSNNTEYRLDISKDFDFKININASKFVFRRFESTQTTADVIVSSQKCLIRDLRLNAIGGNIKVNGTIDASNSEIIVITADARIAKVDIKKMFYQFENFGQDNIQDKNLKGLLTADIQFRSLWSKALEADLDKLQLTCNLNVEKGELNNYAPLKGLSKFVKVEELENVKFATLKNTIEIKNQIISIPKMDISTSAMNLNISGTHTFDNKIDYRIELLLSDVLWNKMKKAKKENEDFGVIEDDGLGKTKLFIRVFGTTDNPQYAYDKKGVKEKIKQDLKNEKQNLKQILNEEFGWFKKDSTVKKQQDQQNNQQTSPNNTKKEKKKKDDVEDGFKVEW